LYLDLFEQPVKNEFSRFLLILDYWFILWFKIIQAAAAFQVVFLKELRKIAILILIFWN